MQEAIAKLQDLMEQKLEEANQVSEPIKRYAAVIKLIKATIEELKGIVSNYAFQDLDEEIHYFKTISPAFFSRLFYFNKVYHVELIKRSTSIENLRFFFDHDLKEIDLFFSRHYDFCNYYYLGSLALDKQLFVRNNDSDWMIEDISTVIDGEFPVASYKVSWIIANEKYRQFIENEIFKLNNPAQSEVETIKFGTWEESKSAFMEWIICLQLSGAIKINGHTATLVELVERSETLFDIDLKEFKSLDYHNRGRKKDLTPFMNSMIEKYKERANRLNK